MIKFIFPDLFINVYDTVLISGLTPDGKPIACQVKADGTLVTSASGGGGGGAVTIADGADVAEGSIADIAVQGDNTGTVSAKLRGISKYIAGLISTAGSASTSVITVQGIAAMTPIKIDGSGVTQPVSGTISVSNFPATQPVSGTVSVSNFPATQPVSGTITANAGSGTFSINTLQLNGTTISTNTGTVDAGTQRVVLASDGPTVTVLGNINDTSIQGDNTGSISAKLRGLLKQLATAAGQAFVTITDGVRSATIKAASTSPVTTDTALVVTNSPNQFGQSVMANSLPVTIASNQTSFPTTNPDPSATIGNITAVDAGTSSSSGAGGQTIITGTPTANSSVSATVSGESSISVQLTGTFTATAQFEKSSDGGTTWVSVSLLPIGSTIAISSVAGTGATKAVLHGNIGANTNFRVRCTSFTSGTIAVTIQPSYGVGTIILTQPLSIGGQAANNAAIVGNPVPIGGYDGTNVQWLGVDSVNAVKVKGKSLVVSGTGANTNDTPIASTDVSDYGSVAVHFTAAASSGFTFEQSDDNVSWGACYLVKNNSGLCTTGPASPVAATDIWFGPVNARYFRARQLAGVATAVTAIFAAKSPAYTQVSIVGNNTSSGGGQVPVVNPSDNFNFGGTNCALSTYSVTTLCGGSTQDRARNNVESSLLASAARTTTTNSADQTNYNGRGVVCYLNITAASGTGGLQLQIQGKDPVSGNYVNFNATPTAIIATGMHVYTLYPTALAVGGGIDQATEAILPRVWRVSVTHGDASSYTYSVGIANIL